MSIQSGGLVGLGAAVGLAVMAATATGDALLAGVLLGLAATDVAAGSAGVLVGVSVIGRWGSSSLAALAGGQAVFGAAGWSGPPGLVLSSWAAAGAVILACPRRRGSSPGPEPLIGALGCGILAAALVAGPAVAGDTASVVGLRVFASVIAAGVALVLARTLPLRFARVASLLAAASAAAVAVLA